MAEFQQRKWLPAATALTERSSVAGSALLTVKSISLLTCGSTMHAVSCLNNNQIRLIFVKKT